MARGGRRRYGRRGGGPTQGDGSKPSCVARLVPAHDEPTPYLRPYLRNGLTYSLDEQEVLEDEADWVIAEEIAASAFDAFIGKLLASLPGDGASINAFRRP